MIDKQTTGKRNHESQGCANQAHRGKLLWGWRGEGKGRPCAFVFALASSPLCEFLRHTLINWSPKSAETEPGDLQLWAVQTGLEVRRGQIQDLQSVPGSYDLHRAMEIQYLEHVYTLKRLRAKSHCQEQRKKCVPSKRVSAEGHHWQCDFDCDFQ